MNHDDLLLPTSTKLLSLFVEYYQLDLLLHSDWVLFEWHVWIRRGNKDTQKEEYANTQTRVHANTHYCQWVVFGWCGCTGRGWQGSSASSTQPPTHTPAATPTPDPPRQYPRYLRYLTIPPPHICLSILPLTSLLQRLPQNPLDNIPDIGDIWLYQSHKYILATSQIFEILTIRWQDPIIITGFFLMSSGLYDVIWSTDCRQGCGSWAEILFLR